MPPDALFDVGVRRRVGELVSGPPSRVVTGRGTERFGTPSLYLVGVSGTESIFRGFTG